MVLLRLGPPTVPSWPSARDLVVTVEGEILRVRMGTRLSGLLEHWHYDTFRAHMGDGRSQPVWVTFVLGPTGQIAELRLGPGDDMAFRRTR